MTNSFYNKFLDSSTFLTPNITKIVYLSSAYQLFNLSYYLPYQNGTYFLTSSHTPIRTDISGWLVPEPLPQAFNHPSHHSHNYIPDAFHCSSHSSQTVYLHPPCIFSIDLMLFSVTAYKPISHHEEHLPARERWRSAPTFPLDRRWAVFYLQLRSLSTFEGSCLRGERLVVPPV